MASNSISVASIMKQRSPDSRQTNIVCTLGPACWSEEMLVKLIDAGMGVARFNFSHGDHASHAATLQRLEAAKKQRPDKHVAVMLDTKGPEIRTGFLASGSTVTLEAGQDLELTTDYDHKGDATKLACSYKSLPTSVKPGQVVLAADGALVMTVKECRETSVICTVTNSCTIGERKNMNLPGVIVDLPTVTEKDKTDIVDWGCRYKVDMIAASFVRKGSDLATIRALLGPHKDRIKIICKIENQEGLNNFDEILAETDGIMVARGDLGMELPPQKVFLAQKMMIQKCNVAGKPVITATQMLESMIHNPRPTRAECTDVANAVLDGTDCVMLSGETAGGKYPEQAVKLMASVCVEAESMFNYQRINARISEQVQALGLPTVPESMAAAAVRTAFTVDAALIVVLTETGDTARQTAKYRPACPILCLTPAYDTARQTEGLLRGVTSMVVGSMIGSSSILMRAASRAKELGWVKSGDKLVAIHGELEGEAGQTNLMKVLAVP